MKDFLKLYKQCAFLMPKETRPLFWLSGVMGVLSFLVEYSFVFVLNGFLFALGILPNRPSFLPASLGFSIYWAVFGIVFFGLSRSCVQFLNQILSYHVEFSLGCHLRKKVIERGFYETSSTHLSELNAFFGERTLQAGNTVRYLMLALIVFFQTMFLFAAGAYYEPVGMLGSSVVLILLIYPLRKLRSKVESWGQEFVRDWKQVNVYLDVGVRQNFFLRAHRKLSFYKEQADSLLVQYQKRVTKFNSLLIFTDQLPVVIGIVVFSFFLALAIKSPNFNSINVLAFSYIFIRFSQSAGQFSSLLSNLKYQAHGVEQLYSWLKNTQGSEVYEGDIPVELNKIVLKNFGLKKDQKILVSGLSFNLFSGDCLLIQGSSGVGKSTLLASIMGIEKDYSGQIIYSKDDNLIDLKKTAPFLWYLSPEPFILPGTVRENLCFGLPSGSLESLSDNDFYFAIKKARLFDKVKALPDELDTELFEQTSFSTGELQRLALARIFMLKKSLVVLDEATANLDLEIEKDILSEVKDFCQNSILILVSHRDSAVCIANKRLDMRHGGKFIYSEN